MTLDAIWRHFTPENERATAIETEWKIWRCCAILTELAAIGAFCVETEFEQVARFAQINAVGVSDFIRNGWVADNCNE